MKICTKKNTLLSLIAGLFITLCLLAVALVNPFHQTTKKVLALELDKEVKAVYDLDEEFIMPKAQLSNGGATVAATDAYIVFPDNTAKRGADFVLDQAGLYSLVFSAEINGEFLKETKDFYVQNVLYSASSPDSPITYKEQTFFSGGQSSGLEVKLLAGEQFNYNKPINIKELGADTPILTLFNENGTQFYGEIGSRKEYVKFTYIRLTDCYDANKYIEIRGRWNSGAMQLQAHQNHQPIAGQSQVEDDWTAAGKNTYGPNDRTLYIDGAKHWVTYDTSWGSAVGRSDSVGWKFYFDYETKKIDVQRGSERKTIIDLDNSDIFDDKLFQDFSSDYAYLSVYGTYYQTGVEYFNLEITDVAGEALSEDKSYIDKKGPDITIDGYDGGLIAIAKDEPFEVLKARSMDPNGVKKEKVSVFYNYGTPAQSEIAVKDGKFTPRNIGEYVIEYKSTDYFGAESVKTVKLRSLICENNQSINFSVVKQGDVEAGASCVLQAPAISSVNGETYYTVYLINKGTGEKIQIENNEFIPNDVGTFEIVYEYGDKYTNKEYAYEFAATQSSNVMITAPALPNYIMANYCYTIDKAIATSFATGSAVNTEAKAYVKENDGEWSTSEVDLSKFKVSSTDVTKVRFKFVDGASGKSVESQDIKVINVYTSEGALAVENYFEGNVTKTANDESVTLTANAASGDVKIDFINALTISNFKLSFSIPESSANFESLKVTLTDYYNHKNAKSFDLVKVDDASSRIYHEGGFMAISKRFAGDSFTLSYEKGAMKEESGKEVAFDNIFTAERVHLSITFIGIHGDSVVSVRQIDNQQIKRFAGDYVTPLIILDNDATGFAKMGETALVKKVDVVDVFSPYYKDGLTVTVYGVKNAIVKSIDGVLLQNVVADKDYEILLEKNVTYKVVYKYADQSGNSVDLLSPYEVLDVVAPTLTLSNVDEAELVDAKMGGAVNIAGYIVSDDCDEAGKIKVIVNVVTPSREKIYLKIGETSFVPDRAGIYTVKYMALDATGNYSTTFYYLKIK